MYFLGVVVGELEEIETRTDSRAYFSVVFQCTEGVGGGGGWKLKTFCSGGANRFLFCFSLLEDPSAAAKLQIYMSA